MNQRSELPVNLPDTADLRGSGADGLENSARNDAGDGGKGKTETALRDPLALAMLAAWLNVRVDQVPETMRARTCADTMQRWKRVGEAALRYHQEHANGLR